MFRRDFNQKTVIFIQINEHENVVCKNVIILSRSQFSNYAFINCVYSSCKFVSLALDHGNAKLQMIRNIRVALNHIDFERISMKFNHMVPIWLYFGAGLDNGVVVHSYNDPV